ncbi:hypothetical protein [Candidatus Poriferisodalis sp.]|uniref:hypothetical protein n=1 Tax=Candidatus Poriferisodalis sp. TaxID=3101277 RepID=UPI003B01B6AE
MDESVGMLSVVGVLVLGIWLVDYSGDASRASAGVRAASVEAAHYAASALASPPSGTTSAELSVLATEVAGRVVGAAAIGDCDTTDQRFNVEATVHQLQGVGGPAGVSVEVTCPLSVSSLFSDIVTTRVAVPVPELPTRSP